MKTKNIFRMLLVAAALLMGANNVKAALPEGENVVWQGSVQCNWGTGAIFSSSSFKNASSGNTVRIYGYFSNGWQTEFMVVNNGWQKFSIPEWGSDNKAQSSTTTVKSNGNDNYVEFELTTGNLPTIQAVNECVVQGINFTVTKVVIYVPSNASISFNPNVVDFVFGGTYEAPTVTKTPADANVTYSSSNTNVAAIDGNGNVVPVGAGSATITGTLANTTVSATYTLNVTAPTRTGAAWTGAAWLGNYGQSGVGTQPQIPTTNLKSAQVGDNIRFYGKLGPLSATDWRCEVHGNPWSNQLGDPSGNDAFVNGYFDLPITDGNIGMLNTNNLILNGYNLTITAVELIPASAPAKQDVTLTFSPSTATATMGEAFNAPTLTATANGETVTGLSISYSSSNTSVATVNASTGAVTLVAAGTTTITASFSGNDNYNEATASYTLTVNAAAEYVNVDDTKIGENGYRTYVTWCAVDLSRSVNVEAYYATGLNSAGTEVEFTQVTGVCASGVPLLLKATVTDASEYKLLKSSAAGTTPTGNKLQAGQGYEVSGDNKYVLTKHSGQVVFAEVNIVGAIVGTEYAYLDLSGSNARGRLSIRLNGESTGISTIQNDERNLDGIIYNLRGQRVENPTKGLYIINGKKVVIK